MSGPALGAIGSVAGGGISALGGIMGSSAQSKAMESGIKTQIAEQENLAGLLTPYFGVGATGANLLQQNIGTLTKPFNPTMADLAATPGYQFTLQQGEQATANAYSGQGLGAGVTTGGTAMTPSGPGAKGAINYAEGLASTTYQQQFQNYLGQNAQLFNMMNSMAGMGAQAAAAWGGTASQFGSSIAGLQSGQGAAQAAGITGAANALGGGISSAGNSLANFSLMNALGGGGGGLFSGNVGSTFNDTPNLTDSDFSGLTDQMITG